MVFWVGRRRGLVSSLGFLPNPIPSRLQWTGHPRDSAAVSFLGKQFSSLVGFKSKLPRGGVWGREMERRGGNVPQGWCALL